MSRTHRTVGPRLASVAVAACALLSACSGGTGSPTDDGTIQVGVASGSAAFVPISIGIEKGFFTDAGVTVADPVQLGSGAKAASALTGGGIDVAVGIAPDVFNLSASGQDVVLLGDIYNNYSVDIVAGRTIAVPPTAPLPERIAALKGRKIGITGPGSGTEALITYLFAKQGLDPATDAQLVSLGGDPSAALNALRSGQVDALSHVLSVGEQAEVAGVGTLYISPGRNDVPEIFGVAHGSLYTLRKVVEGKNNDVKAFLVGYQRSMQYFKQHPEEAPALLQKYASGLDPRVVEKLVPTVRDSLPDTLAVPEDGWRKETDLVYSTGLVSGTPPALGSLVDPALLPAGR